MNKNSFALTADEIKTLIRLVDNEREEIESLVDEFGGLFSDTGKDLSKSNWKLAYLKMKLVNILNIFEEYNK